MFHDKCFIIKASEWLDNSCFQKQDLNISAWLATKINTSLNYLVYRNIYMNKKVIEAFFCTVGVINSQLWQYAAYCLDTGIIHKKKSLQVLKI